MFSSKDDVVVRETLDLSNFICLWFIDISVVIRSYKLANSEAREHSHFLSNQELHLALR